MNPQSWSLTRKYSQSLILGLFLFIGNFSGTMVAPALDLIGGDLGIPAGPERTLILSVSLFAGAVAPMFWAPLIEVYGRIPIMVYPHFLQLIFNTACGFAQTGPQMNIFRFLAAVGSSPPGIVSCCLSLLTDLEADLISDRPRAHGRHVPRQHGRPG